MFKRNPVKLAILFKSMFKLTIFRLKSAGARVVSMSFSSMLNKKVSYRGKENIRSDVIFLNLSELTRILQAKKETGCC